jgi:hypothetical protein
MISIYFDIIVNPDVDTYYGETIDDFENFFASCKNVYVNFKPIQNINYSKILLNKEEEFIDFIIYLCVVSLPIIELCVDRLKPINIKSSIITKQEISDKIEQYYGSDGLTFVLVAVDKFVETFTKKYNISKNVRTFGNWITSKCCCAI